MVFDVGRVLVLNDPPARPVDGATGAHRRSKVDVGAAYQECGGNRHVTILAVAVQVEIECDILEQFITLRVPRAS
jgi:hypothetical protein